MKKCQVQKCKTKMSKDSPSFCPEHNKLNKIKWCWLASEVKGGWRLKLAYGPKDFNVVGAVFKTIEEIDMVTNGVNGKIVFIHLKNTKYPTK